MMVDPFYNDVVESSQSRYVLGRSRREIHARTVPVTCFIRGCRRLRFRDMPSRLQNKLPLAASSPIKFVQVAYDEALRSLSRWGGT